MFGLDPSFVLRVRAEAVRNLRGYRLPPAVGFAERRELEKRLVSAMEASAQRETPLGRTTARSQRRPAVTAG